MFKHLLELEAGVRLISQKGDSMSDKVVVNLATGLEDAERVTVAFLVGVAAAERGQPVRMFLTKEAVRLALRNGVTGVACEGCPPLPELAERFATAGGRLLVCPICFNTRKLDDTALVAHAEIAGTIPLFDWIGGEAATVFSY